MLKLYKFRSLGDQGSFERAHEILTTGRFWCSKLWEQNDPMEGVYCFNRDVFADSDLDDIFSMKNQYRLCAFSAKGALRRPTMWGYYANGFRGLAIEIEVEEASVVKVQYQKNAAEWLVRRPGELNDELRRVLTTKLTPWKGENEYRYLTTELEPKQQIGRITGVYFGDPYGNVQNLKQVQTHSDAQASYQRFQSILLIEARKQAFGKRCYSARIENAAVRCRRIK